MNQEIKLAPEIKETIGQPRQIIIGVWAPMGTGKTTFIAGLERSWPGLVIVDEDYEGNPYLGLAYDDPEEYSFDSQVWSRLRKAARLVEEVKKDKLSLVIPDGVDMSYAKTYKKRGSISERDWPTILRLDAVCKKSVPQPDINIWLTIGERELAKRIIQRDREAERGVDPEFLLDLMKIMEEECFSGGTPVIEVDAEYQDFRRRTKMEEIAEGIEYQIYQLFKDRFKDPSSGLLTPPFIKEKGGWA